MGEKKSVLWLSELSLLAVAIIWGWGFMATRIAVDDKLSASFIMMGRFAIAALLFGGVFFRHIKNNMNWRLVRCGALMGVFLFAAFMLQTLAMERTTPSNAAFLTATNVVIVPFLWWGIAKKRPPARMMAACAICLVGIGLLSVQIGDTLTVSPGDLLSLACAFLFAGHIVLTGLFTARMDAKSLVFVQFTTSAALAFLSFLLLDGNFAAFAPSKGLLAVGYLGVFSTCLCYFMQTTAQQHVPASRAALLLCTESLFGTLFSIMMGYDRLSINILLGGAIIMGSVLLAELTPAGKQK